MPELTKQLETLNGRVCSIERKVNAEGKKVKIIKICKKKLKSDKKDPKLQKVLEKVILKVDNQVK